MESLSMKKVHKTFIAEISNFQPLTKTTNFQKTTVNRNVLTFLLLRLFKQDSPFDLRGNFLRLLV